MSVLKKNWNRTMPSLAGMQVVKCENGTEFWIDECSRVVLQDAGLKAEEFAKIVERLPIKSSVVCFANASRPWNGFVCFTADKAESYFITVKNVVSKGIIEIEMGRDVPETKISATWKYLAIVNGSENKLPVIVMNTSKSIDGRQMSTLYHIGSNGNSVDIKMYFGREYTDYKGKKQIGTVTVTIHASSSYLSNAKKAEALEDFLMKTKNDIDAGELCNAAKRYMKAYDKDYLNMDVRVSFNEGMPFLQF